METPPDFDELERQITLRVFEDIYKEILDAVNNGAYLNISDFCRIAIMREIQRFKETKTRSTNEFKGE